MDRKLIAICILTISAVALMIANFVTPRRPRPDTAVNSRDYQAVTAAIAERRRRALHPGQPHRPDRHSHL